MAFTRNSVLFTLTHREQRIHAAQNRGRFGIINRKVITNSTSFLFYLCVLGCHTNIWKAFQFYGTRHRNVAEKEFVKRKHWLTVYKHRHSIEWWMLALCLLCWCHIYMERHITHRKSTCRAAIIVLQQQCNH